MAYSKKKETSTKSTVNTPTQVHNDGDDYAADLIKQINREAGGEKIAFNLSDNDAPTNVKRWISTGSKLLDYAISNRPDGGFPEGRIIEIQGPPSCHAVTDKLRMFDGTSKLICDIVVGDKLMGPDGCERNVLSLVRGNDRLYRVSSHIKEINHHVSLQHILPLVNLQIWDELTGFMEMTVEDYLAKDYPFQQAHGLYRSATHEGSSYSSFAFNLRPVGHGPIYGVEVDSDHYYLMEDGTVQHNCGKSHLAFEAAKSTQAMGGVVVYIDTENATSPDNLRSLGLDVKKNFVFIQTNCTEEVLKYAEMAILKSRAMNKDVPMIIIWDSIAACSPKAELEGEYTDNSIGLQARVLSKGMRKISSIIANEKVLLLLINQQRMKIGVMYGDPCVDPSTKVRVRRKITE